MASKKNAQQQTYLERAYTLLRSTFLKEAPTADKVVVTYGWPAVNHGRATRVGEHHMVRNTSATGGRQSIIFISPRQWADPVQVLHVLLHEMIHAVVPMAGHKAPFKALAVRCGLEGKMTATIPGKQLTTELKNVAKKLGAFPKAPLNLVRKLKKGSRLKLWMCKYGMRVRVARDDFDATCNLCKRKFKFSDK